ncbi:metallophosphatase family protein [Virgibacillus sp. AGTR]|uniref:metallophosphoesterase family protein n=1 Tax=Virgibacillus TaxID=84406 RepID=UPI000EF5083E|nr:MULTISPECIES: metallophosphoesterase family protein [unclassified Virgibacillus]MCC2250431.1 metallophosphatase family protein [Virgibacillus sp. AGTR]QRZ19864.1 metallophosphoesterase family protein [Virgibacillus sp. AGTR]
MKIAALYDIHGNLPALNAVLNELKEVQPDLIFIGGDIVSGPMPEKTLERLIQLGDKARYIRGNGDREVVMAFDGESLEHMSEKGSEKQQWVANQLTSSQRDFLSKMPTKKTLYIKGLGNILFCHATPTSDEEIFTPHTSKERLEAIFNDVNEPIVVCGHTHIQFKAEVGDLCILNAGSVGMPFADERGAYWLLLSSQGYEFRRTPYDEEAAAKEIGASNDPQAQAFVNTYVQNVMTKSKGMEILESLVKKR